MASAAPPKRMVSSVFITLASPHRATVTQQQPALQANSAPAREKRASQGDDVPAHRPKKQEPPPPGAHSNVNSKRWTHGTRASDLQSPKPVQTGSTKAKLREDQKQRGSPGKLSEELPPPPPPPSSLHPLSPDQHPVSNTKVETCTPSNGSTRGEETCGVHKNGQDTNTHVKDVCGFCRKPVALSEPAIEALNRTYHEGCFQCRSCHVSLAGKHYYNKAGIPLCESCYQASLEVCWACGEVITDQIIRALERTYHPSCFTCKTCQQQIGEQAFAQGEVGEVYCLQDYYRKYAPQCSACNKLIIPKEDGTDSFTVECLGRSYHENCYRCEVCVIQLSPEPNERGCYPFEGKMLCRACHLNLASGQQ
ncbi:filamin-binding LIM protein 1 isoform X2 [Kryptolebias marmoratus]|uniref:filamin-binding LIM protein 1 isoform X2 n=1 Tax=Kryptolebias marmoratus TaxID=37003 RepID=UPI0007F8B6A8|nr:filamin-binding LIM protein 1 isoform X2 [Kryptolebias marmoratus]